ncbi:metallophosphoesterase [Oliverpabstia intestinalis]|uniref:metallophosphoesterase n=1 Tax=Oliverpabstia intestinalis TaxID=2606633 RepID=UPI003F8CA2FA
MIYLMSDVHGRIDLFNRMLKKINLKKGDKLYVLGDSIDRGGGLQVLREIIQLEKQGLCELILGNHEYIFCVNHSTHMENSLLEYYQKEILNRTLHKKPEEPQQPANDILESFQNLFQSLKRLGSTIENTAIVNDYQDRIEKSLKTTEICCQAEEWETFLDMDDISMDERKEIFDFLSKCNREKYLEVGSKPYLLVHGGLAATTINSLFVREEFYLNPVDKELLKQRGYPEDTTVIFGHTTTRDLNMRTKNEYIAPLKIWHDEKYKDKIGIDCGASFPNGQLGCLRLDDMKEFYVKNEQECITPIEKLNTFFADYFDLIAS